MIEWKPTTGPRYYEMLDILPPAAQDRHGAFLVGEPMDDDAQGQLRFQAFKCDQEHYSESVGPVTFAEFKAERPGAQYFYLE